MVFMENEIEVLDIHSEYLQVIEKLKKGLHPSRLYNFAEAQSLQKQFHERLHQTDRKEEEINQVLCLLNHGHCHGVNFSFDLLKLLSFDISDQCRVFALSASMRWVVEYHLKKGTPLNPDFISYINCELNSHPNQEVIEWLLRLIQSSGNQALKFKDSVLIKKEKLKTPFFKLKNKYQKNSLKIIEELEKKWIKMLGNDFRR